MSEICFADYVYPSSCGTKRWEIVNILMDAYKEYTNQEPKFRCTPSDITFEVDIATGRAFNCSVIVGHEVSTYARVVRFNNYTIGSAYNHSYALVTPVQDTPYDPTGSNGWEFLNPFTLPVWMLFLGVILFACVIQCMMRKYEIDVSTSSLNERYAETLSRSILSAIGSLKLYASENRKIVRQLISCCMALFSVFIMSLYSSNLINFFYYQSVPSAFGTSSSQRITVHPAYKNVISYEDLGVYKGSSQDFTSSFMIPYGIYQTDTIPVIPNTWGGNLINSTTRLVMVGYYKSAYQLLFTQLATPQFIVFVNNYVEKRINEYNTITTISADTNLNEHQSLPAPVLTLYNTWGIFVILLTGYILSLIFRITWTKKTGLGKLVFFNREDILDFFMAEKCSRIQDNSSIPSIQTNTGTRVSDKSSATKKNSDKTSATKDNYMSKSPGFMELNV